MAKLAGRVPASRVSGLQKCGTVGSPILNLRPEIEQPSEVAGFARELLARLDQIHKRERPYELELDARISSYELAARLQLEAAMRWTFQRKANNARNVWRRKRAEIFCQGDAKLRAGYVRQALSDGPPIGGTRRPLCADLHHVQIWDTHAHLENDLPAAASRPTRRLAHC